MQLAATQCASVGSIVTILTVKRTTLLLGAAEVLMTDGGKKDSIADILGELPNQLASG